MPGLAKPGPTVCLKVVKEAAESGASIANDGQLRDAFANLRSAADMLLQVDGIDSIFSARKIPADRVESVLGRMINLNSAIGGLHRCSVRAHAEGESCLTNFNLAMEHSNHLHTALTKVIPSTETAARHF